MVRMITVLYARTITVEAKAVAALSCNDPTRATIRCSRGEVLSNVSCAKFNRVRCLGTPSPIEARDFLIGAVQGTLAGELDPMVLGDGGLTVLKEVEGDRLYSIYEPGLPPKRDWG